jgi:hypothetical protein
MRQRGSYRLNALNKMSSHEADQESASISVSEGAICIQTTNKTIIRVHLYNPAGDAVFVRETNASCVFLPVAETGDYLLAFTTESGNLYTREITVTLEDILPARNNCLQQA